MSELKAIKIDHVLLLAHDNEASAKFFAEIMGLAYNGPDRHFAKVEVNDTFTLAFMNAPDPQSIHLAFHVDETAFEAVLENLVTKGIAYGNGPRTPDNLRTDHPFGGHGVFFYDPNGHFFEVMTEREPTA